MSMKLKRKILSIIVCCVMLVAMMPMAVFAAPSSTTLGTGQIAVVPDADSLPDDDELLTGYLEEQMYQNVYGDISFYGTTAGDRLPAGSLEKSIYTELKSKLASVAAGETASASFTIASDISELTWTKEQLGVSSILDGSSLTEEAKTAVRAKFAAALDTQQILECLIADCPYELYWFDKTVGMVTSYVMSVNNAELGISQLTFSFTVSQDYRGSDKYTANTSKTGAAITAVNKAKDIVAYYDSYPEYNRLKAYRDEICDLVSYNTDAASNSTYPYGDPWQFIYVFDGDPDTNVVCEGYAKAFQYLCDLSEFDDIICYTVTGTMTGGTGAGAHMWNVVSYGGYNYLVDVTNCDTGTIGAYTELFMVYAAGTDENRTHTFTISEQSVVYTYDDSQKDLFCSGYLALADEPWDDQKYEYIGGSLNKEYNGLPVKLPLSNILATDNGAVRKPADETGLYNKYFTGEWYEVTSEGTVAFSGSTEVDEHGMVATLVGPTDPGTYKFVARSMLPGHETVVFFTLDFTITPASGHVHSYTDWTKKDDTSHKRVCGDCGHIDTEDHTWDSGEVTTEATHMTEGVMTYTCTAECGATKTEPIEKLTAHTFGTTWYINADQHWHECECGEKADIAAHSYGSWEKVDGTNHKHTCECGAEETAIHTWNDGVVTTEATHLTEGVKTYTCTAAGCGATKTEPIEKLAAHAFGTTWYKDADQHWHECECGEKADIAAHTFNSEDICINCGDKKITSGWNRDDGGWYYVDVNGNRVTNKWIKDSEGWCYVGSNGYCVTNTWMKDSIGWCYLDSNGRMVTNTWVKDSKGWCYLDANGYWDGKYK